MDISETAPVAEPRWHLWAWLASPALAIAIGGGLGWFVGHARGEPEPEPPKPVQVTAKPIVAIPQPRAPIPDVDPREIEVVTEPVEAARDAPAPRAVHKPKGKPTKTKARHCDVYDHMNGC